MFTMTHSNHQVRRNSKACYSKLCSLAADGGQELQSVLLEEFKELLTLQEVCLLLFYVSRGSRSSKQHVVIYSCNGVIYLHTKLCKMLNPFVK